MSQRIGLWTTTSLVIGNMIASAMFMLPATLASYGSISLLGWLVSGIGAICLALVYSWLSQLMPVANGGPYAYTRHGLGDFAAFLVAWGYWISLWCTNAAIAVAFVSYLTVFVPALGTSPMLAVTTGLVTVWSLTWINSRGLRQAGKVQVVTTILKITPLVLVTIGGLFFIDTDNYLPFNAGEQSNFGAITATATLTLFAFMGLECATVPSGHVNEPEKTIPRATLLGTVAVTIIYVAGTVVIMGVLPPSVLKNSQAPFADAAASMWGDWARYLVGAGAVISTFGALNGWILMQGQIPAAASGDKLLPSIFKVENKAGAPVFSLVISSVLVSLLLMMNFSRSLGDTYQFAILLTAMTVLIAYSFSAVAFVIMGAKEKNLTPWKLVVATIAFLYSVWAVVGSGQEAVYWGFILLLVGVPIFGLSRMRG